METITGNLLKMRAELTNPVSYNLPVGDTLVPMNDLLGKKLSITFNGVINCIECGSKTKTSFAQGFCYKCFETSPHTEPCILKPELCMAHMGIARDIEWAKANHLQPHIVYLSITAGVKVGVTRATQIPTRWIDQGAVEAIKLAEVPNRFMAGIIEVFLKDYFSDKTSWQKMLKNEISPINILAEKKRAVELLSTELQKYVSPNDEVMQISYPKTDTPKTIKSANFDKTNEISGTLTGIKGQYLIFDNKLVINIRRHAGYNISLRTT